MWAQLMCSPITANYLSRFEPREAICLWSHRSSRGVSLYLLLLMVGKGDPGGYVGDGLRELSQVDNLCRAAFGAIS